MRETGISYKNKRLLMLGAGLMQIPAIHAAKMLGCTVIVADGNEHAIAASLSDEFWHIDLKDIKAMEARSLDASLDGVMTCATDFSYAVACIAKSCGLVGIPPKSALIANYKHHMRDALSKAQVPIPRYYHVPSALSGEMLKETLETALQSFSSFSAHQISPLALVVKPVDNMGARGVIRISDPSDRSVLFEAVKKALSYSKVGEVIIEECLDGPELSIDSFINEGRLEPLGIADRHIFFDPYFIETGHSIPSCGDPSAIEDACHVLEQAAKAAGIHNGICKGDIIFHEGKAYIGEFAARLSGGYMSGWTIPYSQGDLLYNPSYIAVKHALGHSVHNVSQASMKEKIALLHARSNRYVAERALLMLPGVLQDIEVDKRLYDHECFQNIFLNVERTQYYPLPQHNPQKAGSIIATGSSSEEANTHASTLLSMVYFKTTVNKEAHEFLFSENSSIYNAWRCYPYDEIEKKGRAQILHIVRKQEHILPLPIWIPMHISQSEEKGTWTHVPIYDILQKAIEEGMLVSVAQEDESSGGLLWSAILRAGWQGLRYFIDILHDQREDVALLL